MHIDRKSFVSPGLWAERPPSVEYLVLGETPESEYLSQTSAAL